MSPASSAAPSTSAPRSGGLADEGEGGSFAGTGPAGTATAERWPFVVSRSGTYSSMTRWKLVPPKPNALTPATREWSAATSQSRSSVFTANGDPLQSTLELGRSKLMLGGSTLPCSASVALSMPAAPAAALRWPMFDLTEPSAIEPGATCAPENASIRLFNSTASPTLVEVPCPSIRVHSAGDSPAFRQARSTARR